MESLITFLSSVAAGIVANYICKWLNREKKNGNQSKKE